MIKTRGKCEEVRGDMAGKRRYMSYTKVCKAERDRKISKWLHYFMKVSVD